MCWWSSVMRCTGFTGSTIRASSSPGILRGSLHMSTATDACCADSEENKGKRLCPVLVRVAYDGCLQYPVEPFHESISCGLVGSCPRELNATQLGQGVEELGFKLMSLVGADGLQTTKAGYPAGQ
jgi:hypothetical protein